jgi:hypothetical protein
MTFDEETDMLQLRIAEAQAERDLFLAAGDEERYSAAHVMVEALLLQSTQHIRSTLSRPSTWPARLHKHF